MNRPITTVLGRRVPSWLLDYGPVVFIVVEGSLALASHPRGLHLRVLAPALILCAVVLALRHRAPLAVLAVVLVISLSVGWGPIVILPVLLAVFTVAEYTSRTKVIGAAVVAAAVMIITPELHGGVLTGASILSRLVVVGLPIALGLYLRTRADYVAGLRDRANRLEREQQLLAGQAVAEERVRIARELHDVVAHNVSLMVVQAQALAATGAGDANQQAALTRVAGLGRDALSEMHRMLGVLRVQNGSAAEREPQPGVRELETLIARTRETGLDARLVVQGEPRELPPAVDLSAYRIVQEALTNVIRHAGAEHALVTLSYAPAALEVTITDDGTGPSRTGPNGTGPNGTGPNGTGLNATGLNGEIANGSSPGHGLVGMRERVALFGGELETGGRVDHEGYRVHALLPVA